jgi:hypothetical protein
MLPNFASSIENSKCPTVPKQTFHCRISNDATDDVRCRDISRQSTVQGSGAQQSCAAGQQQGGK